MRSAPEVLAGTRGARTERIDTMQEEMRRHETEPAQLPVIKRQGTTYVSTYRRYRVQVTAPIDRIDPVSGTREIGRPIVAQFEDGIFVNNNSDPATRKMIDTRLQENPSFGHMGSGAHFWLAEDQEKALAEAKLKIAREQLSKMPKEIVEEFVGSLKHGEATDHVLPAR